MERLDDLVVNLHSFLCLVKNIKSVGKAVTHVVQAVLGRFDRPHLLFSRKHDIFGLSPATYRFREHELARYLDPFEVLTTMIGVPPSCLHRPLDRIVAKVTDSSRHDSPARFCLLLLLRRVMRAVPDMSPDVQVHA
eukprot:3752484-Rhodomonas_salina.3